MKLVFNSYWTVTSEIQRSITQSFQKDSLISFLIVCCSSRPHHLVKTSSNAMKAWLILSRPGLDIGWRMRIQWDSHSAHSTLNSSSDIPRLHLCLMRVQCVVHVLHARSKSLAQVFIYLFIIFNQLLVLRLSHSPSRQQQQKVEWLLCWLGLSREEWHTKKTKQKTANMVSPKFPKQINYYFLLCEGKKWIFLFHLFIQLFNLAWQTKYRNSFICSSNPDFVLSSSA